MSHSKHIQCMYLIYCMSTDSLDTFCCSMTMGVRNYFLSTTTCPSCPSQQFQQQRNQQQLIQQL